MHIVNQQFYLPQGKISFSLSFLFVLLLGLPNIVPAQNTWILNPSVPTHHNLYAVSNSCYAVGDSGTIISSSNGSDWSNIISGVKNTLYGILNGGLGFVGDSGTIFIGNTLRESGIKKTLKAITHGIYIKNYLALSLSIIVGDSGTILTSPDNSVWTAQLSGTEKNLNAVFCLGGSFNIDFIAVGDSGTIVTSPDGNVWTKQNSGTKKNLNAISGGPYLGGYIIAAGDSGIILSSEWSPTSPAGIIWTSQNSGTTNNLLGIYCESPPVPVNQLAKNLINGSFKNFYFLVVGAHGTILSAMDSATLWKSYISGTNKNLHAATSTYPNGASPSKDSLIVVGDSGTILTSNIPTYIGGTKIISTEQRDDFYSFNSNEYTLSNKAFVTIRVYDLKGQIVKLLVNQMQQTGLHKIDVPRSLSPGAYILSLNAEGQKIDRLIMAGR